MSRKSKKRKVIYMTLAESQAEDATWAEILRQMRNTPPKPMSDAEVEAELARIARKRANGAYDNLPVVVYI